MDDRKTFFDYAGQTLMIFGFSMIFIMFLAYLVGESTRDLSSMFRLGNQGISIATMSQFLLAAIINTILRYLFFSDRIIKRMNMILRSGILFFIVLAEIAVFAVLFDWFPANQWLPWVSYIVCFTISFGASTTISIWKTAVENKRLEQALFDLKEKWREENDEY